MSVATLSTGKPLPAPPALSENLLTPGQWGVIAFLGSEVAFFSTLIVAYVVFMGADARPGGLGGPRPGEVLSLGLVIVTTICLLASSVTFHVADRALQNDRQFNFTLFLLATIVLGVAFLLGTAYEWNGLIDQHQLTLSRNLFGTTFYTLVGFHALHVTVGVLVMATVLGLAIFGQVTGKNRGGVQLVSWYWHFVDAVWIVVFSVVYLSPRL